MAKLITVNVPPNTTVILPPDDSLSKLLGDSLTISIDNESGDTVTLSEIGSATDFTVDSVPSSVSDGDTNTIGLTVLAPGVLDFDFETHGTTVSVVISSPNPPATLTDAERAALMLP